MIWNYWTKDLDPEQKKLGNTYMVRSRARWSFFQLSIATLQKNFVMQIWIVIFINLLFLTLSIRESKDKKLFSSYGVSLKHIA
jgi:hypothetical protein